MTIAEQPAEPTVRVYPPNEALRQAEPLPRPEQLVIRDVPEAGWSAFQEALTEA